MLTKKTILIPATLVATLLALGARPAAASHDDHRGAVAVRAFFPLPPLPFPVPVWGYSGHSHTHYGHNDHRGCGGHPSYRGYHGHGHGYDSRYSHRGGDWRHDDRGRYGHNDSRRGWPHGR
jgi:hypothetical protein